MNFTSKQLKELKPCAPGYEWYLKNIKTNNIKTNNIKEILIQLNDHRPDWSRWLMVRVLNKEQNQRIAIYCAELVLPIYESKYPGDSRVRDCIQATKDFIAGKISKEELIEKRDAVDYAAYAAYAADYAAYAAYAAADAADGAVGAAYTAADGADAAYADAAYADAAYADAAYAKNELQLKIIDFAVELLEDKEHSVYDKIIKFFSQFTVNFGRKK